ncbi:MAG TPA: hypothetical protein VD931_09065, partial [Baekduia sp.]|nr:hypothetical protein [Baekduia sp.]
MEEAPHDVHARSRHPGLRRLLAAGAALLAVALLALAAVSAAVTGDGEDDGPAAAPRPVAPALSPVRSATAATTPVIVPEATAAGRRAAARVTRAQRRRQVRLDRQRFVGEDRTRIAPSWVRRYVPLYRLAGRTFGVDWRLLASIHRQESATSTHRTTYVGLNAAGCCGGPMQFNVTNHADFPKGSTWAQYRNSFRAAPRPRSYPHRTRAHPSLYDDFDAMMAAAALLRDNGAGRSLDASAWRAAYLYYGPDLDGVDYASAVLARARVFRRHGVCPCDGDAALIAELDERFGEPVRRELLRDSAQERRKAERKRRAAKRRAAKRRAAR